MSTFNLLPDSPSLRVPATKRIALPASQRLSTITEGASHAPDPGRWSRLSVLRQSTSSAATHRTPPPAYEEFQVGQTGNDIPEPVEEEKLARLRRSWADGRGGRGGWGRLVLIVVAVLAILGLAIGLGVGLTSGKGHKSDEDTPASGNTTENQPPDSSSVIQQFPLGVYSFSTNLRAQQTDCTSNSATWRCYPYAIFQPSDPSTATTSRSIFDWIIRNDSALYAANDTSETPSNGIPANLTISSTNNPFALSFPAQPLTYHASASNDTSPRLSFSFSLPKVVVPTSAITPNNAATQCFFNSTVLSGSIYLSASSGSSLGAVGTGSYELWPYAVEVVESSPGGDGVPDCYETTSGRLGARIVEGLGPVTSGGECRCEYRNY